MRCVCGESIHPSRADRSKESSRKTARGPTAPSSPRHTATLGPHPIGQSSMIYGPMCESESRRCSLTARRIPAFGGAVQALQTAHLRVVYPDLGHRQDQQGEAGVATGHIRRNDEPGLLQLRPNLPAWLVSPVLQAHVNHIPPGANIICRMKVQKGRQTHARSIGARGRLVCGG
jgi:hypothetical protein